MSKFITTCGSERNDWTLINLDHVAELRPVQESDGPQSYFDAFDPKGNRIGRVSSTDVDYARAEHVVPDTTGTVLITFSPTDFPYQEGAAVWPMRYPVIAWKFSEARGAEPIVCESLVSTDPWCLELRAEGPLRLGDPRGRHF